MNKSFRIRRIKIMFLNQFEFYGWPEKPLNLIA
jgi:hypothetical protein